MGYQCLPQHPFTTTQCQHIGANKSHNKSRGPFLADEICLPAEGPMSVGCTSPGYLPDSSPAWRSSPGLLSESRGATPRGPLRSVRPAISCAASGCCHSGDRSLSLSPSPAGQRPPPGATAAPCPLPSPRPSPPSPRPSPPLASRRLRHRGQ